MAATMAMPAMPSAGSWFLDAMSLGGGTVGGTAGIMARKMIQLPEDQREQWMEGMSEEEISERIAFAIIECVEAADGVMEFMDSEKEKGNPFDQVYKEVQAYVQEVSKPIAKDEKKVEARTQTPAPPVPGPLAKFATGPLAKFATGPAPSGAGDRGSKADAPKDAGILSAALVLPEPQQGLVKQEDAGPGLFDPHEPLILVGEWNDYDETKAKKTHMFVPVDGTGASGEVHCRIEGIDEEDGTSFTILSAKNVWDWRLFPAGTSEASCFIKKGRAEATTANLAEGSDADLQCDGRDFQIAAPDSTGPLDIKVAMPTRPDQRITVWYEKLAA